MNSAEQFDEIIKRYRTHGWRLARALLSAETRARLNLPETPLADVSVEEALIDALWFARASHEGREAWELRLVADTPYALFETFEADEMEEDREEMRREMEARMRDYATRALVVHTYLDGDFEPFAAAYDDDFDDAVGKGALDALDQLALRADRRAIKLYDDVSVAQARDVTGTIF